MQGQQDQTKPSPPIHAGPDPAGRRHVLVRYLWEYRDRYTEDALSQAAGEAGFSPEEIAEAAGEVARRRRDEIAARPVKARARRAVLLIYGITFLVFAVLFLRPNPNENVLMRGVVEQVVVVVLAFVLLVALSMAFTFIGSRRPSEERAEEALGVMLAVPVVLLVIVSGLCFATSGSLIAPLGV